MARYQKRHPERVKAARKRDYEKHRERRLEGMRRWRKANPEKMKAAEARWRKKLGLPAGLIERVTA